MARKSFPLDEWLILASGQSALTKHRKEVIDGLAQCLPLAEWKECKKTGVIPPHLVASSCLALPRKKDILSLQREILAQISWRTFQAAAHAAFPKRPKVLPKTRKPYPIVMDSPKNKKIETDFMLELDLLRKAKLLPADAHLLVIVTDASGKVMSHLTARESDFGFELLFVPESEQRKRRDSSSLVQVAFWEHALKEAPDLMVKSIWLAWTWYPLGAGRAEFRATRYLTLLKCLRKQGQPDKAPRFEDQIRSLARDPRIGSRTAIETDWKAICEKEFPLVHNHVMNSTGLAARGRTRKASEGTELRRKALYGQELGRLLYRWDRSCYSLTFDASVAALRAATPNFLWRSMSQQRILVPKRALVAKLKTMTKADLDALTVLQGKTNPEPSTRVADDLGDDFEDDDEEDNEVDLIIDPTEAAVLAFLAQEKQLELLLRPAQRPLESTVESDRPVLSSLARIQQINRFERLLTADNVNIHYGKSFF